MQPILKFAIALLTMVLLVPAIEANELRVLNAAPGTPVIDGQVDEVWNLAPIAKVDKVVMDMLNIEVDEASTAEFRCVWDNNHIYVLAEVKDAKLSTTNGSPWEQDSVEFFIDENMARSKGYESNDGQYRVSCKGVASYGQTTKGKIVAVSKPTQMGYLIEVAIPIRTIDPVAGTKVGFEMQVNNDSGKGSRSSISKWSTATNDSWHDTSGFGTLVLSSKENVQPYGSAPATNGDKPHKETVSAAHRVPDWAQDAIFYQIFPERFRNGDPSNDPTHASLEFPDIIPKSWRVTKWTADWYARDEWEKQIGDNFFEDGVFHRRYGGDLQGVIDKLDYLSDLGINTLYFNPVFHARSLHKYDGNSFHHVDPHFGPDPQGDFELMSSETSDPKTWNWTKADKLFLKLVKQAHQKEMRVVIDGVFNHTGRDFWAFANIAKNQKESPYLDWYTIEKFDDSTTPENEFKYACWWGVDTLPEFANNEDGTDLHPKPKAYIMQATQRWMDPDDDGNPNDGIDGWRLDVANEVPNQFWRDWHSHVRKLNPNALTVAEIWEDAGDYLADCGFGSTMNYHGFAYPVKGFLIDGNLSASEFGKQLTERMAGHPREVQFALQNLIDSHDTDRVASMIVNADHKFPYKNKTRFDYDVGERVSPRGFKNYDVTPPTDKHREIQKLVGLFQATFVGPPMVYYGTEAGMDGADDPCDRMPMVWEDLKYDSRTNGPYGKLSSEYLVSFNREIHDYYRNLFKLRADHATLRRGDFKVLATDDDHQAIVFSRSYEGETVVIAINRGGEEVSLGFEIKKGQGLSIARNADFLFESRSEVTVNDGEVTAVVAPKSGFVWEVVDEKK